MPALITVIDAMVVKTLCEPIRTYPVRSRVMALCPVRRLLFISTSPAASSVRTAETAVRAFDVDTGIERVIPSLAGQLSPFRMLTVVDGEFLLTVAPGKITVFPLFD